MSRASSAISPATGRQAGRRWYAALAMALAGAMAVWLLGTAGTASAAPLLSEDFEQGVPAGWSKSGGTWQTVPDGGSQVLRQSNAGSSLARQFGGNASWSDYRVEARVKPEQLASSGSFVALAARQVSATRMYRLALYPDRAELHSVNGSQITVIGARPMAVGTGSWYTLAVSVTGDVVSGTVNGQQVGSGTNGAWEQGRIGLVTGQAAASFDDVVVTGDPGSPDPTDPDPTDPDPTDPDPTDPDPTDPDPTDPTDPGEPTSTLFVAPQGRDNASGTVSDPTTLAAAVTRITPGGTIYLRGGTYRYTQTVDIVPGNSGTASAPKRIEAYQGETPVLNFAAQSEDSTNRGLQVNGSHWRVSGIVVERAGDNGIFVGGSNNVFERVVTRFNRDTGLQISRATSSTPHSQWPAHNLVVSSVSHDNADSDGEDADGFAAKLTSGPGNVFRHTVAHNNIDDGWDLYTKSDTGAIGAVTIEDSLALENGTLSDGSQHSDGDRNGYKLGGEGIAVDHTIRRNIAYDNGKHGFTFNRNTGRMAVSDNLSIRSEERNFNFDGGSSVLRGNTSCDSGATDRFRGDADDSNQFWSGSNGSRCADYTGALAWSFDSGGRLVVTIGGRQVTL